MAGLGRVCLLLALAVCAYGVFASLYGVRSGRPEFSASGRRSVYALAQTISQRADQSRQAGARTAARGFGLQAADTLWQFLVHYPESPLGDEAAFAYGVNLAEQERYEEAATWCARSAKSDE